MYMYIYDIVYIYIVKYVYTIYILYMYYIFISYIYILYIYTYYVYISIYIYIYKNVTLCRTSCWLRQVSEVLRYPALPLEPPRNVTCRRQWKQTETIGKPWEKPRKNHRKMMV